MVQDPRTASSHHRLRPLNEPQAVVVDVDTDGRPVVVTLGSRRIAVQQILDYWRIDDEWWREGALSRFYWQIALEDGRPVTVFFDLVEQRWWKQSY